MAEFPDGLMFTKSLGTPLGLMGVTNVPYVLYDAFLDTLAAGSVNGSLATPPAGISNVGGDPARVVTDTNSKLSLAGGVASFATGGVGSGDPGLWYPSQARVLGRVLIAKIVSNSGAQQGLGFGWDADQTGTITDFLRFTSNGVLRVLTPSAITVGSFVDATTYDLAVVQRSSGYYWFIKGGAFSTYTLLWQSTVTNSSVYPAVVATGTASIGTADNVRISVALYIPAPLAYDTFTRADGSLGVSEILGPDAQAVSALAWTAPTYTISTNKAINTPTLGAEAIVNGGFGADTDWNKGAGWAIAAGVATATASDADLTAVVAPLVVGTWYSVTYTVSGFAAGTVNAKLGSTAFPTHAANGTYTETGLALTTAFAFTGAGFSGSLDNVSCKPLTLSELIATMAPGVANYLLDINGTLVGATDGKQIGIISNLDSAASPANFRLCILDGRGNQVCYECIAGVYTVMMTTAITYSVAATIRNIIQGTDFRAFYNGAVVGSLVTMTANANQLCGIFSTSPLSSLDVWQALARGTSGEYAGLNSY